MILNDFMSTHPVPDAPVKVDKTPRVRTAGSMRLVDNTVCKVGCTDHEHVGPTFVPDASLDEVGVGWTAQHIPTDPGRHLVPKKCIFCWEALDGHACRVVEVVNG